MQQLGERLAAALQAGATIYLVGDLGAGKTTLVRGVVRGMGYQGAVRSPTYTLLEPYSIGCRQLFHLDLYRLADPEELEFLGLRDLIEPDSVIFVEWPDHGRGFLPQADLVITIEYAGEARLLKFESRNEVGVTIAAACNGK
ncbi:tRNA (adenosine(37)-N6)-threonylcarbamoyltransferase complex ATPase subunit type 1 TsaE [Solemya pervernicosa gill symbiont]|uniref:tRNA threonylcarbamoyladenosine biosynthesis protein TsaE n=3 Tax=Gammaproteobacteria incertae sedis TaxID=118884 RepID=A0A1T2L7V0_9GAMM|nr:tRNA (adenosine(37)-N6)-threonylcarbamoyltransferase complex ATPase subunit type 1 TsaE [Solemya pervernicosa gill symbiont]QKQ28207.1 tRNA (adenosine(37)-N6)-threonylcarbamoyltransferase complex ATPase subunit type 1 TsaE [Candidatus Reidiella endopervernicosa]